MVPKDDKEQTAVCNVQYAALQKSKDRCCATEVGVKSCLLIICMATPTMPVCQHGWQADVVLTSHLPLFKTKTMLQIEINDNYQNSYKNLQYTNRKCKAK
jgi:hypothetical protein